MDAPSGSAASCRARLRADVRARAEDRPGVYRMIDPDGAVVYVGKSVRIRSRLLSYFRAPPGKKAAEIVRAARRIRWEYVPNEFWALIRELRLIKRWRPRYNVEHVRRARYAFVKLTHEAAPRLLPVSRIAEDGGTYFGPFPRPAELIRTVRELSHVLGLRDCAGDTLVHFGDQLDAFGGGRVPRCLRAETESCLAPCAGQVTESEYGKRARVARHFLEGTSRKPVELVMEEMRKAAARREFEYASILRDRAHRLDALRKRIVGFRGRVEGLSFVYRVPGFRGDDRLYVLRRGQVVRQLPHPKGAEERREAVRVIRDASRASEMNSGSPTAAEAAEILLVARWFRRRPKEAARTAAAEEWIAERAPRERGRAAGDRLVPTME